jgi:hypothetical protein
MECLIGSNLSENYVSIGSGVDSMGHIGVVRNQMEGLFCLTPLVGQKRSFEKVEVTPQLRGRESEDT